jgi:hypothetical protein
MNPSETIAQDCCGTTCDKMVISEAVAMLEADINRLSSKDARYEELLTLWHYCNLARKTSHLSDQLAMFDHIFEQTRICEPHLQLQEIADLVSAKSSQFAAQKIRNLAAFFNKEASANIATIVLEYAQAVEDQEDGSHEE